MGQIANLRHSYVSSKPKSSRQAVDVGRSRTLLERTTLERLRCRYDPRRKFCDQPQDVGEQVSWNGDLGHLEGDIAAVADDLRRSFAANAVRLQLHALAYNLGNFLRTLATPEPIKDRSLSTPILISFSFKPTGNPHPLDPALAL
jgi:hypothetical protein